MVLSMSSSFGSSGGVAACGEGSEALLETEVDSFWLNSSSSLMSVFILWVWNDLTGVDGFFVGDIRFMRACSCLGLGF